MKPRIRNIAFYFYIKYFVFYLFMMFKTQNYALISMGSLKTFQDVFYYLFIFLSLPTLFTILFAAPVYYSFRQKNAYWFKVINLVALVAEYFIYTSLASQMDYSNGIYGAGIGIAIYIFLFYKAIFKERISYPNKKA